MRSSRETGEQETGGAAERQVSRRHEEQPRDRERTLSSEGTVLRSLGAYLKEDSKSLIKEYLDGVMSVYMSWVPTLFDLDGYQSPVAGQDSSALEEAFDIHHQVFEQVFPEEVEQNRSFLSSIRPDLQEQLLRDIDVGVDLVGRSLDHGFRALNDSLSAK
ncbi:hypothetical protein KUCAC02_035261, partial [Chaenocephalus aceratus]